MTKKDIKRVDEMFAVFEENFDGIPEDHEFSDAYRARRDRMICRYRRLSDRSGSVQRHRWHGLSTAALLAIVLLVGGGTVFAAVQIARLRVEQTNRYQVEIIPETAEANATPSGDEDLQGETVSSTEEPLPIPVIEVSVGYLPEGVVPPYPSSNYYFRNEDGTIGGQAMTLIMDSDEPMIFYGVDEERTVLINDREAQLSIAAYDPKKAQREGATLLIPYPELFRTLSVTLYADDGVMDRETLVEEIQKIGASIVLTPTGENKKLDNIMIVDGKEVQTPVSFASIDNSWEGGYWREMRWGDVAESREAVMRMQQESLQAALTEDREVQRFTKDDMKNLHTVGQTIPMQTFWAAAALGSSQIPVEATVTDVQILDDLSVIQEDGLLDSSSWYALVGSDGKLLPDTLQYIKAGNGMDTIDTVAAESLLPVKLLYVTVEYHNTSDQDLEDVMFIHDLRFLEESKEEWTVLEWEDFLNRAISPAVSAVYDSVIPKITTIPELSHYYDAPGRQLTTAQKNHISLKAGETQVIHCATLITEDMFGHLYLDLTGQFTGPGSETSHNMFWSAAKEVGLVDLNDDSHLY